MNSGGAAYVTGRTASSDFPTNHPFDANLGGSSGSPGVDALMTKLSPNGAALDYSTFLGGRGTDIAYDIAIDSFGMAYITGTTDSGQVSGTGNSFPLRPLQSAFDSTFAGGQEAFIAKLNPNDPNALSASLLISTYLGGNAADQGHGIAIGANGMIYVGGQTLSSSFPASLRMGDGSNDGNWDGFVARLTPALDQMDYFTFIGGAGADCELPGDFKECAIAVDADGNAYVTGMTASASGFPVTTSNAYDTSYNDGDILHLDGFLTKVDPSRSGPASIPYSTYLGGTGDEYVFGIAVSQNGIAYLTGRTHSANFPMSADYPSPGRAGTLQPDYQGNVDAVLAAIDPSQSGPLSLLYSTFLGGSDGDGAIDIAVATNAPKVYLAGTTYSASDFPPSPPAPTFGSFAGGADSFVTALAVPPAWAPSHYVTDVSTLGDLGAMLGVHDRNAPGTQNNLVILDFGYPDFQNSQYGADLAFDPSIFVSQAHIIDSSVAFANRYFISSDSTSRLRLVIGTNNCCSDVTLNFHDHGVAWAQIVNAIQSRINFPRVDIVGGNDMELDFNDFTDTKQWVDGYVPNSQCSPDLLGCLYNFGNAPCTSSGECNNNWTRDDVWYISWGVKKNPGDYYTFARPLPEIYSTFGTHATQWKNISLYAATCASPCLPNTSGLSGHMYFIGSLTQFGVDNTPPQGWMQLWGELYTASDTQQDNLPWSTNIRPQP